MKQSREKSELTSIGKKAVILLMLLYLLNLGAGIVEFPMDNIPLAGNIDEAIATIIALKLYESL